MENWNHLFTYDELAFFGKVNASISHELKNILAIISETAGLLSDLAEMSKGGSPVEPEMLTSTAESIIEEIQRGFTTIRQMNRFAHCVDTPVLSVNLMELLDLVGNLSNYLSYTGKTRVSNNEADAPIVLTCPFILQAILYQAMLQAFQNAGPAAEMEIAVQRIDASAWRIVFYTFSIKALAVFPDDRIKRMAASIGVRLNWDRAADRLEIDIPVAIKNEATQ
jgi:phosphoglycerate-specific signal transduction histidine kinase